MHSSAAEATINTVLSTEKQIATALRPNILSFCPNDFMLRVAELREDLSGKKGQ